MCGFCCCFVFFLRVFFVVVVSLFFFAGLEQFKKYFFNSSIPINRARDVRLRYGFPLRHTSVSDVV